MKQSVLGLVALMACGASAYEPIVLQAKDFALATGTPTLQMWQKDAAVVPVWSLSGGQVGQSVVATTPPLPADCGGQWRP